MTAFVRIGDFVRGLRGWGACLFAFAAGALSALGFCAVRNLSASAAGICGPRPSDRRSRGHCAACPQCGMAWMVVWLRAIPDRTALDRLTRSWSIRRRTNGRFRSLRCCSRRPCAVHRRLPARLRRDSGRPARRGYLVFTIAYTLAEWLRGHVLTGFPWNIAGYGWGASTAVMQSAALFGVYGLTLATILLGASLARIVRKARCVMAACPSR